MKPLLTALILLIALPAQALAAPPAIQQTQVATATTGYEFNPIDYTQTTEAEGLIDLGSNEFINQTGSMAVTVVAMVSEQAGLSIYILLLLTVLAVVFLFAWLYGRRIDAQLAPVDAEINQLKGFISDSGVSDSERYGYQNQLQEREAQAGQLRERRGQFTRRRQLDNYRRLNNQGTSGLKRLK